jgi:hypothetical protein
VVAALTAGSGPDSTGPIAESVKDTVLMLAQAPKMMDQTRANAAAYAALVDPHGPYRAAFDQTGGAPVLPAVPGLVQFFDLPSSLP